MHTEYVKHLLLQNSIFPLLSRLVLPQEQNIPIIVIYDEEMAANSKITTSGTNIDNTLDEPVMTNRNNLDIDEPAFQVMIRLCKSIIIMMA